jgi:hypothetical protein
MSPSLNDKASAFAKSFLNAEAKPFTPTPTSTSLAVRVQPKPKKFNFLAFALSQKKAKDNYVAPAVFGPPSIEGRPWPVIPMEFHHFPRLPQKLQYMILIVPRWCLLSAERWNLISDSGCMPCHLSATVRLTAERNKLSTTSSK